MNPWFDPGLLLYRFPDLLTEKNLNIFVGQRFEKTAFCADHLLHQMAFSFLEHEDFLFDGIARDDFDR